MLLISILQCFNATNIRLKNNIESCKWFCGWIVHTYPTLVMWPWPLHVMASIIYALWICTFQLSTAYTNKALFTFPFKYNIASIYRRKKLPTYHLLDKKERRTCVYVVIQTWRPLSFFLYKLLLGLWANWECTFYPDNPS